MADDNFWQWIRNITDPSYDMGWAPPPPPRYTTNPLLILAGNHTQARAWVDDMGIKPDKVRYVIDETYVRGIKDPVFVVIGTFWERQDALQIWRSLMFTMTTALARIGATVSVPAPPPKHYDEPVMDGDPQPLVTPPRKHFKKIPDDR